jgi:Gram-negative bacterial TonB protein C-terminal
MHINGNSIVAVIVDEHGMPKDPRMDKGLEPGMDQNALIAVEKYRFKPAVKDGTPIPVKIGVEAAFRLPSRANSGQVTVFRGPVVPARPGRQTSLISEPESILFSGRFQTAFVNGQPLPASFLAVLAVRGCGVANQFSSHPDGDSLWIRLNRASSFSSEAINRGNRTR